MTLTGMTMGIGAFAGQSGLVRAGYVENITTSYADQIITKLRFPGGFCPACQTAGLIAPKISIFALFDSRSVGILQVFCEIQSPITTHIVISCDCRTCMEQSSYQHHSINLFAIFQETT